MSDQYQPELGQMCFGQPHKQFRTSDFVEAVLASIRDELDRVQENILQQAYPSPFGNTGNTFRNDTFEVHAYSWADEEQPFNFKWGDIEISWYKYLGRGMSANQKIDPTRAAEMLTSCLESLRRMDNGDGVR